MIEFGVTPLSTRVSPCSVTPRELITKSEGTISGLAAALGVPIVFIEDAGAFWASAAPGPDKTIEAANSPAN